MKKLIYISALVMLCAACEKPNNAMDFQGPYIGTFKATYQNKTETSRSEITLNNRNFEVYKGVKLGSGVFTLNDKKTVTFEDKNTWPPNFDAELLLNGSYTFEALGDSLILTKYVPQPGDFINTYQYRLRRILKE